MAEKITMYRFKVSLIGPHEQPIGKLHRIIDVAGNAPFVVLHELIFEAFDRFDPHLFKFMLTRKEAKSERDLFGCTEEVGDLEFAQDFGDEGRTVHDVFTYTLDEAGLKEKEFIYYWFDFGDDWLHRLRLEKIFQINDDDVESKGWYAEIVKKVGDSPPQYDEDSMWEGDSEAAQSMRKIGLLLVLADPQTNKQLNWGDLVEEGVADLLVEEGWVLPGKKSSDAVALTAKGLKEAAKIKLMIGED